MQKIAHIADIKLQLGMEKQVHRYPIKGLHMYMTLLLFNNVHFLVTVLLYPVQCQFETVQALNFNVYSSLLISLLSVPGII